VPTIVSAIYRNTDIVAPTMPKSTGSQRPMATAVFHILIALADQPRHGYGIMLDVADRTSGKVKLSPGTLYGSIKQLLEDGLIEELTSRAVKDADERRRYYRLTREGREAARAEMARMATLLGHARVTSLKPERG
jgi:DNA-binding PadR family transcriptional regulator